MGKGFPVGRKGAPLGRKPKTRSFATLPVPLLFTCCRIQASPQPTHPPVLYSHIVHPTLEDGRDPPAV
jgi:hypothetical protein